jgi:hypothetical protein
MGKMEEGMRPIPDDAAVRLSFNAREPKKRFANGRLNRGGVSDAHPRIDAATQPQLARTRACSTGADRAT